MTALLLVPTGRKGPVPAILWLHSSTPDKTQVIIPGTNGGAESLGETFVRAGYAVLAPDSYWHGDRAGTGPSGTAESGRAEQEDLFKLNLWLGRTLWGMFVRDDQVALDYLCSRPEVDASRIGATGMSMGSTRAWWLAAVDERVAAVVAVACLTRYQNLIAHGELRQHGVYYFVNGLLKHFDTEGVLALIAPRPFLCLTGELDAGSPADGVRALERAVGGTYQALGAGDRFRSVLYPEVGHAYTPEMRAEMLAWFGAGCDRRRSLRRPLADPCHTGPWNRKHGERDLGRLPPLVEQTDAAFGERGEARVGGRPRVDRDGHRPGLAAVAADSHGQGAAGRRGGGVGEDEERLRRSPGRGTAIRLAWQTGSIRAASNVERRPGRPAVAAAGDGALAAAVGPAAVAAPVVPHVDQELAVASSTTWHSSVCRSTVPPSDQVRP